MKYSIIIAYVYSALVAVGGMVGFIVAGSIPSLIAGLSLGLLYAIFTTLMLQGKSIGATGTLALAAVYACFFLYRFVLTYKFMPAGLMFILSIAVLIVMIKTWQQQQA